MFSVKRPELQAALLLEIVVMFCGGLSIRNKEHTSVLLFFYYITHLFHVIIVLFHVRIQQVFPSMHCDISEHMLHLKVLCIESSMAYFADRRRHDYTCLVAATVAFVHLSLRPDWITFHLTIAVSPSLYCLRLYSHMCCDMIIHVV